ncbi:hypothetical protein LJR225_002425 [Phenylobacterium sp. LjRoot225]|uniref:hypothetical protein n=1 Tax=Phenylobacterium sp. LjRoot225 TaxID=3342285 RepID=UPI003ECDE6FC
MKMLENDHWSLATRSFDIISAASGPIIIPVATSISFLAATSIDHIPTVGDLTDFLYIYTLAMRHPFPLLLPTIAGISAEAATTAGTTAPAAKARLRRAGRPPPAGGLDLRLATLRPDDGRRAEPFSRERT